MWTPDAKETRASRLVIKCVTLSDVTTHAGQLIGLPDDIHTDPNVNQIFVASAEDMAKNGRYGSPILATISLDSTLRLYAIGPCVLHVRPNLKPI